MRPKIFIVWHSHIDPVWQWRWHDGAVTTIRTFRNALRLLRDDPEFKFTTSSAALFHWVSEYAPDLLRDIRVRIRQGRWCIAGGWWVEPDCNLPCGESLVRQGLYGQMFFEKLFGVRAVVGYNIDSFGHNWQIPQILSKMGIKYYVFMRPNKYDKELPSPLFWWVAPDGSRVLAYRIPQPYGAVGKRISEVFHKAVEEEWGRLPVMMMLCGRGDHGGGPSQDDLDMVKGFRLEGYDVTFATPEEFFREAEQIADGLPEVKEDLQHYARGCYTSVTAVKKLNRRAEHALLTAEKACCLATVLAGLEYPREMLRDAWLKTLFNQFHDILAGSSIPEAYEDSYEWYGDALTKASLASFKALFAVASKVKTDLRDGFPVFVFNPSSWDRKGAVELKFHGYELPSMRVFDSHGREYPCQIIEPERKVVFLAEVPAMGYKVYWITEGEYRDRDKGVLKADEKTLENDHVRLEFDPETGFLKSIYVKPLGEELLRGVGAAPLVFEDRSDAWGHGVTGYGDPVGSFRKVSAKVLEQGPVRARLRIEYTYNSSSLRQDFILYRGTGVVEVRAQVNWGKPRKMLKLAFSLNIDDAKATFSIPYGFIERPVGGGEEPGQAWVDLTGRLPSGREGGLAVVNDCKYGYDVKGSELRMSILRSAPYSGYDAATSYMRFMDIGVHEFTYLIIPHHGDWRRSGVVKAAWELNEPLTAFYTIRGDGNLEPEASLLKAEPSNIVVTVLKMAEEGDELIVRAYETHGRATEARFTAPLQNLTWTAVFRPQEIKTFRLGPGKTVKEVSLLEEPMQ